MDKAIKWLDAPCRGHYTMSACAILVFLFYVLCIISILFIGTIL